MWGEEGKDWGDIPSLPESTDVACYVAGDAEVWGSVLGG